MNNVNKKSSFEIIKTHLFHLYTLRSIDIDIEGNLNENDQVIKINFIHFLLLALVTTLVTFAAYLIRLLLSLKIAKFAVNAFLPYYIALGLIASIILSIIGGKIYSIFLDIDGLYLGLFYLVLLSTNYIPIIMLLSIFMRDLESIFLICGGICADFFLRNSLMRRRRFTDKKDKIYFIVISMLMNVGAYWFIYPLFFFD